MLKALLGLSSRPKDVTSGIDVAERPRNPSRIGFMPESDSHIPGIEKRCLRRILRRDRRACPPSMHAARARSALYVAWEGAPGRRDLLDRNEAAHQEAQACPTNPNLLFIDERTNGMDPKAGTRCSKPRDLGDNKNSTILSSNCCRTSIHLRRRHRDGQGAVVAEGPSPSSRTGRRV